MRGNHYHQLQMLFELATKQVSVRQGFVKNGTIRIHERENSIESENHLNENREHFSKQCQRILEMMNGGARLTRKSAMNMGINSLERRCKDLRDNGIPVQSEWVKVDGRNRYKEYFINNQK